MEITIEGASPEFERELLAEHRHELTITAGTFARLVIKADGSIDADELRAHFDGELRGPTIALSRAVPRGVREGHWPEGTPAPITPLYSPDNPSWRRAILYELAAERLPAFREALARLDQPQQRPPLVPVRHANGGCT